MSSSNLLDEHKPLLEDLTDEDGELRLYPVRWAYLLIYVGVTIANNNIFITFGPLGDVAKIFYGFDGDLEIQLTSLVFVLSGVVLMFPSMYFIKRWGLRRGIICCGVFTAAGGVIRALSPLLAPTGGAFWVMLVGQAFCAVANPMLNFLPAYLAAAWFGPHERSTATAVGALSTLLGLGAGYALSFIVQKGSQLYILLIIQGAMAIAAMIPSLFFKDKPPTPPSFVADKHEHDHKDHNLSFKEELLTCLRRRMFLLLCAMFFIGYGLFVAIFSSLDIILAAVVGGSFTSNDSSALGLAMLGAGVAGAVVAGLILDNTGRYVGVVRGGFIGSLVFLVSEYLFIYYLKGPAQWGLMVFAMACFGFFAISLLPSVLETGVEITFPIDEEVSSGLAIYAGNLGSIFYIVGFALVESKKLMMLITLCTGGLIFVALFFFHPRLLRREFEAGNLKVNHE